MQDYKRGDSIKLLAIVSYDAGLSDVLYPHDPSFQEKIRSLEGIPQDLERKNPHAWQLVESRVGYELTQIRSAIKKVVSPVQANPATVHCSPYVS